MKLHLSSILAILALSGVDVKADIVLELIGDGDFTVQQGRANSPDDVFPLVGETLLVWGRLRNDGAQDVALTGPGGLGGQSGFGPDGAARHPRSYASLWTEFPYRFWDPDEDIGDPIVTNPNGYSAIVLQPGEEVVRPILEVWGVDFSFSDDPFYRAAIGGVRTWGQLYMSFWDGLDRDPNDVFDRIDVFVPLDRGFSVTVVPEPMPLHLLALIAIAMSAQRACR